MGIRIFRLARKVNLSDPLVPVFEKLADFVPKSRDPVEATIAGGAKFVMPPGYRDTRSVVMGLFQESETKLFQRMVLPGMAFVDVGAYVGYFTVLAANLVGSAGRVYAFEPNASAYDYLLRNISANRFPNVVAVNKAVADDVKSVALIRDPTGPETYVTTNSTEVDAADTAEATSLDAFFASQQWPSVDVIKMNIEGSELRALLGMRELSRRNRELKLIMEHNPEALERAGVERSALADTLRQLGFIRAEIIERNLERPKGNELLPSTRAVYNVLFTK